jgi:hypothetical protein
VLSVCGDESHDPTKSRVFAVAGLLGDAHTWDSFRSKWTARTGGIVFHAADCESGYGDFKHIGEADRHRLHRNLTSLLADSNLLGWGCVIDVKGCRDVFPETVNDMPDMVYYDCFLKTVVRLCDLASRFIPSDRVEFTFDRHRETQYNSGLLYNWLSTHRPQAADVIKFGTRREVGVQAADLWAREVMKRCDGWLFDHGVLPRPQWHTLKSTRRFNCDFHLASYFASMKSQMEEVCARAGFNQDDYEKWVRSNNLVDNLSNRFRYCSLVGSTVSVMKEISGDFVEL